MPAGSGLTVSKCHALGLLIFFLSSLVVVGLLVYFFAGKPSAINCSTSPKRSSLQNSAIAAEFSKPLLNVRLPRNVLPRHYDVRLFPILETGNLTILGQVAIDVECTEDTDRIVLHSTELTVNLENVQLVEKDKAQSLSIKRIDYEAAAEFIIIHLSDKLIRKTNYTLSMSFVAKLTESSAGFFRVAYLEDGQERNMAITQMEPTDARRVFPCFDEPNMKATFTVTLGRHRDMMALSNMPLVDTTEMVGKENFVWDHFARSLPMSPYLMAFAVTNFTKIEADVGGASWKFNIHVRTSAVSQAQFAKVIGPKAQAFYEYYFQVPFPLPKQDLIAIPKGFVGAMENWGLVTFGESFLLFDETVSSIDDRQTVVEFVTHELAHQWFGNLVTMEWWTDLWLKEGFTSYVECLAADHVYPPLERLQQFVADGLQDVMRLDALESSHPISALVYHPDEIGEIFDDISYKKGAAITRMLANFVGEKSFRDGIAVYLKTHQYGNAGQDDLWNAFNSQANADRVFLPTTVKELMNTWTLKTGFPVITVRRNYTNRNVVLSQERFLIRRSNNTVPDTTVYLWWVPLTYTTDFQTVESTWLADNQTARDFSPELLIKEDQWVIFNVNQTGYYRVNYDSRNWQLINEQLMSHHTTIPIINRAQIMNDALNLARAGLLDYDTALGLTRYLERETDYLPWKSTIMALSYVDSMLRRTSGYSHLKEYVVKIMSPLYNYLEFLPQKNESHLVGKLHRIVVDRFCSMGHRDCTQKAIRLYERWMSDPKNTSIVPPVLKGVIACTAIRHGGEWEWSFALRLFRASNVASERTVLLSAMACTQDSWILAKMLDMCLNSTDRFQEQDALHVIKALSENHVGRYVTFNFIREKWIELTKSFTAFHSLARVFESVTKSFNTEMELKELSDFVGKNKELLASTARSTQQSIDRVKSNVKWMKRNYHQVVTWLQRASIPSIGNSTSLLNVTDDYK